MYTILIHFILSRLRSGERGRGFLDVQRSGEYNKIDKVHIYEIRAVRVRIGRGN